MENQPPKNPASDITKINLPNIAKKIEKWKKEIRATGQFLQAAGWLTIAVNIGLFLWQTLDKKYSNTTLPRLDFTGALIMSAVGFLFIVLGRRIVSLSDRAMRIYLWIALVLSLSVGALVLFTGGRIGFLFFFILFLIIRSLFFINKLMKVDQFVSTLENPVYTIGKKSWGIIVLALVALLGGSVWLDFSIEKYRSQIGAVELTTDLSSWKEFRPESGRFHVTFPNAPKQQNKNSPIPNVSSPSTYDTYVSAIPDGTTYFVVVGTYGPDIDTSNPQTNIENTLAGMLGSLEGIELISSIPTTFESLPAIDFVLKKDSLLMKGRIFMKEKTMYQIMMASQNAKTHAADYDRFIGSFGIEE